MTRSAPLFIRRASPVATCFAVAFTLAFARAIGERVYSDEQLFLGGAGLMARGGGLIYRDFLYNHMPTHALLLAGLFRLTSWWTLAARTFDALCAAAIATLIFESARRASSTAARRWQTAIAAGVVAIFLFNPVTADAIGKAWNHDLAALACLAGYLLLCAGLARARPTWQVIASGVCAAIAATSRLTFAPLLAGFPLLIALAPPIALGARLRLIATWGVGLAVGASPAMWVWRQAPDAAYFGNFRFNAYSARYHVKDTVAERTLVTTKFHFIQEQLAAAPSLSIFVALAAIAIVVAIWQPHRALSSLTRVRLACLTIFVVGATAVAFVPSPIYRQYLYGPLPFAALAIAWATASIDLANRRWLRVSFLALAATCVGFGASDYAGVRMLASPRSWIPVRAHSDSLKLAMFASGPGKILTLAPGIAMEGNRSIYRELSIGRYGLRIAELMKPKMRSRLRIPDMKTVDKWFDRDPPAAVLLVEPKTPQEIELAAIAVRHGYQRHVFDKYRDVYTPQK